jgi:hypothetical protein
MQLPYTRDAARAISPIVSRIQCYLDTIEIFVTRWPDGVKVLQRIKDDPQTWRASVEAQVDAQAVRFIAIVTECRSRNKAPSGYRIAIHQPKLKALHAFDDLQTRYHGIVRRFDIAVDFGRNTVKEAAAYARWLLTHTVLRWLRHGPMKDFENGGVCWINHEGRKRLPNRNLDLYSDFASKLTRRPAAHLEIRIQSTIACRREGVRRVLDVLKINPSKLCEKHLALSDIGDRHAKKIIKQAVDAARERHRQRSPISEHVVADRHRGRVHVFAATVLRKSGGDRAQTAKAYCARNRVKLTRFQLGVPSKLTPFT